MDRETAENILRVFQNRNRAYFNAHPEVVARLMEAAAVIPSAFLSSGNIFPAEVYGVALREENYRREIAADPIIVIDNLNRKVASPFLPLNSPPIRKIVEAAKENLSPDKLTDNNVYGVLSAAHEYEKHPELLRQAMAKSPLLAFALHKYLAGHSRGMEFYKDLAGSNPLEAIVSLVPMAQKEAESVLRARPEMLDKLAQESPFLLFEAMSVQPALFASSRKRLLETATKKEALMRGLAGYFTKGSFGGGGGEAEGPAPESPSTRQTAADEILKNTHATLKFLPHFAGKPYAAEVMTKAFENVSGLPLFYFEVDRAYRQLKVPEGTLKKIEEAAKVGVVRDFAADPKLFGTATMWMVNQMHNFPDLRFRPVDKFSPQQLFQLVSYGRQEAYTSSYLGIMDRLLGRLDKAPGSRAENYGQFIAAITSGDNRKQLPLFMEAAASYNRMGDLFSRLSPEQGKTLVSSLFSSVRETLSVQAPTESLQESRDGVLRYAVALADAMRAFSDKKSKITRDVRAVFEKEMIDAYKGAESREHKTAFGLVVNAYLTENPARARPELFNEFPKDHFAKNYELRPKPGISEAELFPDGRHFQQKILYDDADAHASYKHFLEEYKGKGWMLDDTSREGMATLSKKVSVTGADGKKTEREMTYVLNLPGTGVDGMQAVQDYIRATSGRLPDSLAHVGHSTHTDTTKDFLHPDLKFVFWRSCGGYNLVSDTFAKSPDADIAATRGTGTMHVNDPMGRMIAEHMLKNGSLTWEPLWKQATAHFQAQAQKSAHGKEVLANFENYMPPDKNFAHAFNRAYQKILARGPEVEPAERHGALEKQTPRYGELPQTGRHMAELPQKEPAARMAENTAPVAADAETGDEAKTRPRRSPAPPSANATA